MSGDTPSRRSYLWLEPKTSSSSLKTKFKETQRKTMKTRKPGAGINLSLISLILFSIIFLSLHLYHYTHSSSSPPPPPLPPSSIESSNQNSTWSSLSTVSILIPDWQILVLVSPETPPSPENNYTCLFPNNASSPASFFGQLPSHRGGQAIYQCEFPSKNRRIFPFLQPRLVDQQHDDINIIRSELLRWNFLAYESFVTEHDVVLFVKGVNYRQGINRHPSELRCVFGDDLTTAIRTPVTSSEQEVFRCLKPRFNSTNSNQFSSRPIRMSLEIRNDTNDVNVVVPSVAHYKNNYDELRRTLEVSEKKSLMCACTMVYNVAKFLREWVTYHATIGVEKFVLYDNGSDDHLEKAVQDLNRAGFDVRTVYWPWPKTQEAGFSHCALLSHHFCHWLVYVDVDEFVLSPTWLESSRPEPGMLSRALLPKGTNPGLVGQVSIKCLEFGPSNQTAHPAEGVTQGYTCRRKGDHRHKSIVLLEAMHPSLLNVVHHFKLRPGYRSIQVGLHRAVVNHYKYQAWPEFRAKFRRRVSAYVVDWRKGVNPTSNDRALGLGFEPIEPKGWPKRFCEVKDERLKMLTRKWFGVKSSDLMAWQSS